MALCHQYAHKMHKCIEHIPVEAMERLVHYDGRAMFGMQNVIECAVILSSNGVLCPHVGAEHRCSLASTVSPRLETLDRRDARAHSGSPAHHQLGAGRASRRRGALGHEAEHTGTQDGEARIIRQRGIPLR